LQRLSCSISSILIVRILPSSSSLFTLSFSFLILIVVPRRLSVHGHLVPFPFPSFFFFLFFFFLPPADPRAGQRAGRVKDPGRALCHADGQCAVGAHGGGGAAQDLDDGGALRPAGLRHALRVGGAVGALVGQDGDDATLAQRDGGRVAVDGPGLVAEVGGVDGDGAAAQGVELGRQRVQRRRGRVLRQPRRLAVVGVVAARVVLLLARVDDGDAVVQQREGENVAGLGEVGGVGGDCVGVLAGAVFLFPFFFFQGGWME
jgi:hypothetical protein